MRTDRQWLMNMLCPICCDEIGNTYKKIIECNFCHYQTCSTCTQTYLLGTIEVDAHCMNCRKGWTREMLLDKFPKKFVAVDFKKHREELMFDREKALLPATQAAAEQRLLSRKRLEEVDKLKHDMKKYETWFTTANPDPSPYQLDQFKQALKRMKSTIIVKTRDINIQNKIEERYPGYLQTGRIEPRATEKKETRNFVRACPVDGCRGFLSSAWKCGMCNTYACAQCHEVKGDQRYGTHVCKPENVETAKLLVKDTKPCPSCGTGIFKIDGCDQMWCIECHTAFCWKTGEIVTNNIHNPHYFEYVRKQVGANRREAFDIPCGGLPNFDLIREKVRNAVEKGTGTERDIINHLSNHYRTVGEMIDLRRVYRNRTTNDTREIRIKYLLHDYDETEFKRRLQINAKAQEKISNIDQVIEMYIMASSTLLHGAVDLKNVVEFRNLLVEISELRRYTNDSLKRVGTIYDCKVPLICDDGSVHRVGERKC